MHSKTNTLMYIKIIFHKQAIAYITAEDYVKADQAFHIRNEFACLHTGLFTKRYDGIYMCFERNKRKNSMLEWYFKGWADKSSPWLKYVEPLPKRPLFSSALPTCDYFPEWEIRVNVDHILGDEEKGGIAIVKVGGVLGTVEKLIGKKKE